MSQKPNQTVLRWDLLKTAIVNQIIIVLVVFFTLGLLLSSFVVSEIRRSSENIVSAININIEEIFKDSSQTLDEIYHLYVAEQSEDPIRKQRIFNVFRNSDSAIEGVMILDGKGMLIDGGAESELLMGTDFSNQSFVKNIPKIGDTYWTGVSISSSTGQPMAYISKRFEKYVVVIRLNLKDVGKFIENFKLSNDSEIALTDSSGIYLINKDSELVNSRSYDLYIKQNLKDIITKYKGKYYIPYVSKIYEQGWMIIIYQSINDFLLPTVIMMTAFLVVAIILIFIVNGLNYRSLKHVTEDLTLLEQQALEISEGNYDLEPIESKYIEIKMLSTSFQTLIENIRLRERDIEKQSQHIMRLNEGLEKQVEQRTRQLEEANGELLEAYDHLKEAQNLIVQNEKLAALGQMVSGVAHELNTPIGNAYTASTFIRGMSKDLQEKVLNNQIKKSEFIEMVSEVEAGSDIIFRNLQAASDLILNFKQISADHQHMEWRSFNLHEVLKNLVISFGIDLRNAGVTLELLCREDLVLKSYPGALVHIVSNLIRNALVHGFEDRKEGHIRIEVIEFSDMITMIIQDNGIGMSEVTLGQIYDPFYTTKRSKGGTGLGLNIVHNMITNVLLGSITCSSEINKGTEFRIQMPKVIVRESVSSTWNG